MGFIMIHGVHNVPSEGTLWRDISIPIDNLIILSITLVRPLGYNKKLAPTRVTDPSSPPTLTLVLALFLLSSIIYTEV